MGTIFSQWHIGPYWQTKVHVKANACKQEPKNVANDLC
jgi:hypothetical protein